MATSEEQRKQKIMEHLQKTTELPQEQPSLYSEAKKQIIMEHIKMTRG
ncbi:MULTISPECIES: hypothetical protein [unclassified Moorena]|uniref:Uncharacterized protein n=1 Tax=Moorena producens 3L TaxID=489825 RepID=F4XQ11_9CYAN|nr:MULTISPECIES: hypothetical protein [unclassified Moorena]EGJ33378.1 hypothetical protein LYNGBM3L_36970 [Moorena producens 3L]